MSLLDFFTGRTAPAPAPIVRRSYVRPMKHKRDFVGGQASVTAFESAYGARNDDFSPAEYAEYIATSNGVYACSTLRATLLASLPLKLYRVDGADNKTEVTRGKCYDLLHRANPFWTTTRLLRTWELSLCLQGQTHGLLERGPTGKGTPTEMWWAKPHLVRVVPDPVQYIKGYFLDREDGGAPIPYTPGEVIWLRYENPIDEFAPLSPLAAARIAADLESAAMKSNRNIFENGIQAAAMVMPGKDQSPYTNEQRRELEQAIDRRLRGVDKAHRWGVFAQYHEIKEVGMNPHDAEFLGSLDKSLEFVARAYHVPLDLIGGQRTYQNVEAAMKAVWTNCVLPEAQFIAGELTEQLLPLFPGEADAIEFDHSGIEVLQEDRSEIIQQMQTMATLGVPLNVLLQQFQPNLLPPDGSGYPWGNVWWAPMTIAPVSSGSPPPKPAAPTPPAPQPAMQPEAQPPTAEVAPEPPAEPPAPRTFARAIEYGGEEHARLWGRFAERTQKQEERFGKFAAGLFQRQRDSVLARLKGRAARSPADVAADPFDLAQWVKTFRVEARPEIERILSEAGQAALDDLSLGIAFDVSDPNVVRFLEKRAQRFAREVNQTTWDMLKASLAEGLDAGESIPQLAERVNAVMGERIRSSPETIARTECVSSSNAATLLSWREAGDIVGGKTWLATLDPRTRPEHAAAHGQTVKLDEPFIVGGERLDFPGDDAGSAGNVIQCFPGDTLINISSPIQAAVMRPYSGDVVTIRTSGGKQLTGTPNHPILTRRGWIALGKLMQGDYLVCDSTDEEIGATNPNPQGMPTEIGQVFHLLEMAGELKRVLGSNPQFHGDGMNGEVDIVLASRLLWDRIEALIDKPCSQNVFAVPDVLKGNLATDCSQLQFLQFAGMPLDGGMSGSGQAHTFIGRGLSHAGVHGAASVSGLDASLQQSPPNDGATDTELASQGLFRSPGNISLNHGGNVKYAPSFERWLFPFVGRPKGTGGAGTLRPLFWGKAAHPENHSLSLATDRDTGLNQVSPDNGTTDTIFDGKGGFGYTGPVLFDQVISIETQPFHGPVYNLQTEYGYYTANGIIVHNCRCTVTAVLK